MKIMAKRLVYKKSEYKITLKGKKQNQTYTVCQYNKLIYSDVTEGTEVENLFFEDCCSRFHYDTISSSSKFYSKYLGVPVGTRFFKIWIDNVYSILIHDKNLVSFEVITIYENCSVDSVDFTLEYLMKKLSANEMIEYLKDNNLNTCPIIK